MDTLGLRVAITEGVDGLGSHGMWSVEAKGSDIISSQLSSACWSASGSFLSLHMMSRSCSILAPALICLRTVF